MAPSDVAFVLMATKQDSTKIPLPHFLEIKISVSAMTEFSLGEGYQKPPVFFFFHAMKAAVCSDAADRSQSEAP